MKASPDKASRFSTCGPTTAREDDMLLSQVTRTVDEHGMLSSGDRVMVGLSGGPDSLCLFYLQLEIGRRRGFTCVVGHVNHMLRGAESDAEELFVRDVSSAAGVPAVIRRVDVAAERKRLRRSTQVVARELRYRFFREACREHGCNKLALGHTLDDQAETMAIRLLRGAGPGGLAGIPPTRVLGEGILIVRPLIEARRRAVEAYLERRGIGWCSDSSNIKLTYLRNRVRHELFPYLEGIYGRDIVERLGSLAKVFREENALVESWSNEAAASALHTRESQVAIDVPALLQLPAAIQRRLVLRALRECNVDFEKVSRHVIARALELCGKEGSTRHLAIDGRTVVTKVYGELVFGPRPDAAIAGGPIPLVVPGTTDFPEAGLRVVAALGPARKLRHSLTCRHVAHLDADRLPGDLVLRTRRPGDRFVPYGMSQAKKLKAFLIDEKIPWEVRDRLPLVVAGEEIVWVVGVRIADPFKVTSSTSTVLRLMKESCREWQGRGG